MNWAVGGGAKVRVRPRPRTAESKTRNGRLRPARLAETHNPWEKKLESDRRRHFVTVSTGSGPTVKLGDEEPDPTTTATVRDKAANGTRNAGRGATLVPMSITHQRPGPNFGNVPVCAANRKVRVANEFVQYVTCAQGRSSISTELWVAIALAISFS